MTWATLGIPRTRDRDAIRRAYAARLRETNPEDDADGFMALRTAYEAALRHAGDGRGRKAPDATPPIVEPPPRIETPADLPAADDAAPSEADTARQDFERQADALATLLTGPSPADAATLTAAATTLLRLPALDEIVMHSQAESWMARLIATNLPRSDALIRPAVAAFGWSHNAYRPTDHFVATVLRRLDVWREVEQLGSSEHPLHAGWLILTQPPLTGWRAMLRGLRDDRMQVAAVLQLESGPRRGIADWFDADSVAAWSARLKRPLSSAWFALPDGWLLAGLGLISIGFTGQTGWIAVLAAVILTPILLALPEQIGRAHRNRAETSGRYWLYDGWFPALLILPIAGAVLPPGQWTVLVIVLLSIVALGWLFTATSQAAVRMKLAGLTLTVPFAVYGLSISTRNIPNAVYLATGFSLWVGWLRARPHMVAILVRRVPRYTFEIVVGLALALGLAALARPLPLGSAARIYWANAVLLPALVLLGLATETTTSPKRRFVAGLLFAVTLLCMATIWSEGVPSPPARVPQASAPDSPHIGDPRIEPHPAVPIDLETWLRPGDVIHGGGTTAFQVKIQAGITVNPAGQVSSCQADVSAPPSRLGLPTCSLIMSRARFLPARDGYGTAVIQMITMTVLWRQLPGRDAYAPLGLSRAAQAVTPVPVPRDVEPTRRGPECPPDPPLAFAQSRPPIPCSDSATWISTSQFPDALLIQAGSRTIKMRYDVGRDGYVGNCRLEKSSGVPEIDKDLCKLMVRNAHYVPGRDGNGRTVGYVHTFEWGWTVTSRPRPMPAVPDAGGSEPKLPATSQPDSPQSPENQGIEQPARQPKDAGTPGV